MNKGNILVKNVILKKAKEAISVYYFIDRNTIFLEGHSALAFTTCTLCII